MKKSKSIQYTIRGVSARTDALLREKSARESCSLNEAVLHVLEIGLGGGGSRVQYDDLDDCIGTWENDNEFDQVVDSFDVVDRHLWK